MVLVSVSSFATIPASLVLITHLGLLLPQFVRSHAGEHSHHGDSSAGGGPGGTEGMPHYHESVSLDQAKIRLEQLRSGNVMESEEHIREHLQNVAKMPEEKMNDEQRATHFFYLHDMDQDTKLDGLEILHSIMESHGTADPSPEENKEKEKKEHGDNKEGGEKKKEDASADKPDGEKAKEHDDSHPKNWSVNELVEHIDSILTDYDKNDDGYIDFFEFREIMRKNREDVERDQKAEEAAKQAKKN